MTKKQMSAIIAELREFGWIVKNLENNRKTRAGVTGLPDFILLGFRRVIFMERKIDDKLSPEQKEIGRRIQDAELETCGGYKNLEYILLTPDNILEIKEKFVKIAMEER